MKLLLMVVEVSPLTFLPSLKVTISTCLMYYGLHAIVFYIQVFLY